MNESPILMVPIFISGQLFFHQWRCVPGCYLLIFWRTSDLAILYDQALATLLREQSCSWSSWMIICGHYEYKAFFRSSKCSVLKCQLKREAFLTISRITAPSCPLPSPTIFIFRAFVTTGHIIHWLVYYVVLTSQMPSSGEGRFPAVVLLPEEVFDAGCLWYKWIKQWRKWDILPLKWREEGQSTLGNESRRLLQDKGPRGMSKISTWRARVFSWVVKTPLMMTPCPHATWI